MSITSHCTFWLWGQTRPNFIYGFCFPCFHCDIFVYISCHPAHASRNQRNIDYLLIYLFFQRGNSSSSHFSRKWMMPHPAINYLWWTSSLQVKKSRRFWYRHRRVKEVVANNFEDICDVKRLEREARKAAVDQTGGDQSKFRYEAICLNYLVSGWEVRRKIATGLDQRYVAFNLI